MIIVTGFAHTGTSFLCQVLADMGYRFSRPLDHMEDVPLRKMLNRVNDRRWRGGSVEAVAHPLGPDLRSAFAQWEDTGPELVVKQPALIHCLPVLLACGIRPDSIILCRRALEACRASNMAYGTYGNHRAKSLLRLDWMQQELHKFLAFVEAENIPTQEVHFPRSVTDRDHIPDALAVGAVRDRWYAAWERRRRVEMVHFGG